MLYSYVGIKGFDKKVKGRIAAQTELDAKKKLEDLAVHDAELKKIGSFGNLEFVLYASFGKAKLTQRDMVFFFDQMYYLLRAGMSESECIDTLTLSANENVAKLAFKMRPKIISGVPIDEAMNQTKLFPYDIVAKVEAGRRVSRTKETFLMLSTKLKEEIELKSKIKSSLTYPAFMVVMLVAVLIIMLGFIVPSIGETVREMGGEMPALTLVVIGASDFVVAYGLYILLGIVALVVTHIILMKKVEGYCYRVNALLYKLPAAGKLLIKSNLQSLSSTLSQLLQSGMTIADALEVSAKTVKNLRMREAVKHVLEMVRSGGYDVYVAMQQEEFFPKDYVQIMMIGNKSGDLVSMLDNIAEQYSNEVQESLKRMTSLVEPLAIVATALVGGVCVIAMYLPMFSLFETMGATV